MGGYGSGRRHNVKPKLDDCLCLDINRLIRRKFIFPDKHVTGAVEWKSTRSGVRIAEIGYEANLAIDSPYIRLHYGSTDNKGNVLERFDYTVFLTVTTPHYGGKRYWFICPRTGMRTNKLHMHENRFMSRKGTGLAYESQSLPRFDRAANKKWRIGDKIHDPVSRQMRRPKGMHFKTYYRLMREFDEAHRECVMLIPLPTDYFSHFPEESPFH